VPQRTRVVDKDFAICLSVKPTDIDRSKYDRLVDMGWLTPFETNISDVEYQATEKDRGGVRSKRPMIGSIRRLVELGLK
jgi:hypothetical protein